MPIYEFEGKRPTISAEAFIHPEAVVVGEVSIGAHCFIGPGAAIRAEASRIVIKEGTSVQDNAVIHVDGELTGVCIEEDVIVGHSAIIHDAHVMPRCVIGMGAILLYDVVCEEDSVVAAGSVLLRGMKVPARTLVAGNPARIVKEVSPGLEAYVARGIQMYRDLTVRYLKGMKRIG